MDLQRLLPKNLSGAEAAKLLYAAKSIAHSGWWWTTVGMAKIGAKIVDDPDFVFHNPTIHSCFVKEGAEVGVRMVSR